MADEASGHYRDTKTLDADAAVVMVAGKENGHPMPSSYSLKFVGSDTSATALSCLFMLLLTHPNVYRKLQTEIDECLPQSEVLDPEALQSRITKMEYLDAVMCVHEVKGVFKSSNIALETKLSGCTLRSQLD